MFEVSKMATMKSDENSDDFAISKRRSPVPAAFVSYL